MSNRGKLSSLPWEVMFMILDQLPPHSRVALALTTKPLFRGLYPSGRVPVLSDFPTPIAHRSTQHPRPERDLLLLLLEKDDPTRPLCVDCRRLCAFESGRGHLNCAKSITVRWYAYHDEPKRPPLRKITIHEIKVHPLAWLPDPNWPVVHFGEARQVMNRHLYGEPHGLPLSSLEYKYEFERLVDFSKKPLESHFPLARHAQGRHHLTRERQRKIYGSATLDLDYPPQPWTFKHVSEAKIMDDELYIARSHSINGPLVPRREFLALLNSLHLPICRHTRFSNQPTFDCPYMHETASCPELNCLFRCRSSIIQGYRWCYECYTDWSVSIRRDKLTGWHCTLETYHRLGEARDPEPNDSLWELMKSPGNRRRSRFFLDERSRTRSWGEVRRQWRQSNGEAEDQDMSLWEYGRYLDRPCCGRLRHRPVPDTFPNGILSHRRLRREEEYDGLGLLE